MRIVIYICLLLLLVACGGKTKPQQPTYHNGWNRPGDSAVIQLVAINEKMANEADRQLAQHSAGYALWENGSWVSGWKEPEQPMRENERVRLQLQIYDMDDTLLEDILETVTVGQYDRMQALADILPEAQRGAKFSMLVPWYLGYGATGNEHVAPYTNLRIVVSIEE